MPKAMMPGRYSEDEETATTITGKRFYFITLFTKEKQA
jgi:hypothetical protein